MCSVPWATSCDPLGADAERRGALLNAILDYGKKIAARKIELRLLRAPQELEAREFRPSACFKHHWLPLNQPLEEVTRGFSRTAVRAMVSRARKRGYSVSRAVSQDEVELFHALFASTRQRLRLPLIPLRFFLSIWSRLRPWGAELLLARLDDRIVAGLLVLKFGSVFTLEYFGEAPGARGDGVGQLLYFEAISLAAKEGYQQVSFGRTAPDNAGLLLYKQRWGCEEQDLVTLKWPVERSSVQTLRSSRFFSQTAGAMFRYLPLAGRRALGEIVYRFAI